MTSTNPPEDSSRPVDGAVLLAVLALSGAFLAALTLAWHDPDLSAGRVVAGVLAVALVFAVGLGHEHVGRAAGLR